MKWHYTATWLALTPIRRALTTTGCMTDTWLTPRPPTHALSSIVWHRASLHSPFNHQVSQIKSSITPRVATEKTWTIVSRHFYEFVEYVYQWKVTVNVFITLKIVWNLAKLTLFNSMWKACKGKSAKLKSSRNKDFYCKIVMSLLKWFIPLC